MKMRIAKPRSLTCVAQLTCVICMSGCSGSSPIEGSRTQTPKPNVVLITLDTTRADHLSCYGYEKDTSPNLDALAQEATLFRNAIATASVTPVSHASILTGLYPYSHGLRVLHGTAENRLPDDEVTLAEMLKKEGYETAAFISAFPSGTHFGLGQGFDTFNEDYLEETIERIVSPKGNVNTRKNQRTAGPTTDLALRWHSQAKEPYCLWLHYFDPHDSKLLPPDEFLQRFSPPTVSAREQLVAIYDIEIQYMDLHIGRVIQALRDAGQMDHTIIVVVSDHGEGLGDHDWWTHGILYQEQIRTPLIIRAPGMPAAREVGHLVRTIDIVPTVLELIGIVPDQVPPMEGKSLASMLREDIPDPGYSAYADSVNMLTYRSRAAGMVNKKDDRLYAVMDGQWKYIHHLLREQDSELYHIVEDREELTNLYAIRPDQVKRLLADLRSRSPFPRGPLRTGAMSPEDVERLRSIGYSK